MSSDWKPMDILLVEDNPGDVVLVRRGLGQGPVEHRIHVAGDGVAAMRFLRREGEHEGAPRPDLVILDLNLPKMGGAEVLREIKADRALTQIPVVVLSSSDLDRDVQDAYDQHASCYVNKPGDLHRFLRALKALERFWRNATVPRDQRSRHSARLGQQR